jgi:hypothetical protein
MKKKSKFKKPREATALEFAERTGVLEKFRNEHSDNFNGMTRLLIAANRSCSLHLFAFDLDQIIYIHGRRLNSPVYMPPRGLAFHPDYLSNQKARRETLEQAVRLLTGVVDDLRQLDVFHLVQLLRTYKSPLGAKNISTSALYAELELARQVIQACHAAHSSIFPAKPKRRGRRSLPHVEAASELIDLWERYTGKKVPISKTHGGKTTNNAAEFVRLGISLIDSNISDANAVTAINNVLSRRSPRQKASP